MEKHQLKLHHTGFIVKDIDAWAVNMLLNGKVKEVIDPLQNARLTLYNNYSEVLLELIQPLNEKSFTWNALAKNGNHFNHFCYEIENVSVLNEIVQRYKLLQILAPVPAVLFDNRYVCFYYSRNKQIVEFLITDY